MNEEDTIRFIEKFSSRKVKQWTRLDKMIARMLDTFLGLPQGELEDNAALFFDAWVWDTGADDDFNAYCILKWMIKNNLIAEGIKRDLHRNDNNMEKMKYIQRCMREGIEGKVTLA